VCCHVNNQSEGLPEREGHQFWFASGYGGQLIVMVPDEEIVIVINADYSTDPNETGQRTANTWNLLREFLLRSIQENPRN